MRADRLLSILMLLQSKGSLTAHELAQHLEVTERTIYRDVTALSTAGIPIYTTKGPGGGIALVEEYRSNLTGLRPDEVQALFLLSIPPALEQLGVGETLRNAFLKLSLSLPKPAQKKQKLSPQRILLDAENWNRTDEAVPWLRVCQEAIQQQHKLEIIYRSEFNTDLEMLVIPLGLVSKADRWYLIISRDERLRTLQVSRIRSARLRNDSFHFPEDFDLTEYWKDWCAEHDSSHHRYKILVRVTPTLAHILANHRPTTLMTPPMQDNNPWQDLTLEFESFDDARRMVLGYGGAIKVVEPLALRRSVEDFARQILAVYNG
ncbi:MAG: YafY family protein [Anaerolineaceae bacterium]|nr:YafY family protein [Anaerolineaceae bacterium]